MVGKMVSEMEIPWTQKIGHFHLYLFPQLYVEGLLFSRPRVCRPCLLEPFFFDPPPPRGPRNTLITLIYIELFEYVPAAPKQTITCRVALASNAE